MSLAPERLIDPDGYIAGGVDPDFILSSIAGDGSMDYPKIHDYEKNGNLMEAWYGK